jgi:hypothetical protein
MTKTEAKQEECRRIVKVGDSSAELKIGADFQKLIRSKWGTVL